jgi:hypothetical protein
LTLRARRAHDFSRRLLRSAGEARDRTVERAGNGRSFHFTRGKIMNRRTALALTATALFCMGAALPAAAQQKTLKDQITGTWSFASTVNTRPDGTKVDPWGPGATGSLIYYPNGRFAFMIMRGDIPKFERDKGSPEQFKAAAQGLIAYHGTYSVNEAEKTIVHRVVGSSFAAFNGTEVKRTVTSVTADELKYTNPASSFGTKIDSTWKRAK